MVACTIVTGRSQRGDQNVRGPNPKGMFRKLSLEEQGVASAEIQEDGSQRGEEDTDGLDGGDLDQRQQGGEAQLWAYLKGGFVSACAS